MSRDIPAQLLSQWVQTAEPGEVEAELGDIRLIPVESSNLAAVGYDPERYELYIAFLDGSLYRCGATRRRRDCPTSQHTHPPRTER